MKVCGIDYQGICVISPAAKVSDWALNPVASSGVADSDAKIRSAEDVRGSFSTSPKRVARIGGNGIQYQDKQYPALEYQSGRRKLSPTGKVAVIGASPTGPKAVKPDHSGRVKVEIDKCDVEKYRVLIARKQLVSTWKKLCAEGKLAEAVEALDLLAEEGSRVDSSLLYVVLKRCTAQKDLGLGKRVHAIAVKSGYVSDAFLANHIIGMYGSHGRLDEAMQVFTQVTAPNTYMWASIISAHARYGCHKQAIQLYKQMRDCPVKPDSHIYVAILKACVSAGDLAFGKEVHADILRSLSDQSIVAGSLVATHIILMYASHGRLEEAYKVFTKVVVPDTYMWASIIRAHADHGQPKQAINLYRDMRKSTVKPNSYVFVPVLKACASTADLAFGKQVHADVLGSAVVSDVFVGNSLVDMYAKCGSIEDARKVFDGLPTRDVVTWTAMIAGYAHHGLGKESLAVYASMQQEGITPADRVTFICLLQACGSVKDLQKGKQLHAQICERGLDTDLVVGNCLVDMYAKCRSVVDAQQVFDKLTTRDVVTWTAMIAGYAQQGLGQQALTLYESMQQDGRTPANRVTFVCLLQACASIGALHQGKQLHAEIQEKGLEVDLVVGTCLVDMYSKCGDLDGARKVFDSLHVKNVVTWNAMIGGYAQHERGQEALALYARLQQEGTTAADHITFVCLLQACASVGALHQGKQLHAQIQERGMGADVSVCNCLVDMYAKCGSLVDARKVFDTLPEKDVVTWTALLTGYAEHNEGKMAIQCFEEMLQQGVEPDGTTFTSLLVACSHDGLVSEGTYYFNTMVDAYGLAPTVYHYACMVDLMARSGRLDEAEAMMQTMPCQGDVVAWTSLLSACKNHGDLDRGARCFDRLTTLDPENATPYVLLATMYANAGRWRDVERIEGLRKSAGAKKKGAKACIEVKSKVHEFCVGEERADISLKLKSVNWRLKDGGHVPQTELVLKAVPDREKEDALCGHAEKLALAYGLLNTPDGTPLLVTKNLRMCNDCHSATKVMSRVEKREIIVRDAHRVHRFVDASCSCGDRH